MENEDYEKLCDLAVSDPMKFKEEFHGKDHTYNIRVLGEETILHFLSVENHTEPVKVLIEMGFDVNCTNSVGDTPLADCAALEHWEMIEILLESGADPNIQNEMGDTALHTACEMLNATKSKKHIISLLLKYGADPNIQNEMGDTALHLLSTMLDDATEEEHDIISLLLKLGADPEVENNFGFKALKLEVL